VPSGSSGTLSVNVSGLTANTTYYFQVVLASDAGFANSTNGSFTTLANAPVVSAPTVILTASPVSLPSTGGSSVLTWTTTGNPTSCTATGGTFTGAKSTAGSSQTIASITSTTIYTLICSKTGFTDVSSIATVTVGVVIPPVGGLSAGNLGSLPINSSSSSSVVNNVPTSSPTANKTVSNGTSAATTKVASASNGSNVKTIASNAKAKPIAKNKNVASNTAVPANIAANTTNSTNQIASTQASENNPLGASALTSLSFLPNAFVKWLMFSVFTIIIVFMVKILFFSKNN
ncbi:MAG TPA: hypothetical protein VMR49_00055, partial [Candidatus Paceibacterota bacterium]|nr:hypothetical protein [Candidatus Paceibacterota bacterium]